MVATGFMANHVFFIVAPNDSFSFFIIKPRSSIPFMIFFYCSYPKLPAFLNSRLFLYTPGLGFFVRYKIYVSLNTILSAASSTAFFKPPKNSLLSGSGITI